jgi:hypothetical protein
MVGNLINRAAPALPDLINAGHFGKPPLHSRLAVE